MAVTIISRAGWGAKPAESVTPWNPASLLGICQHWFGSPKAASTHAGCDDLLRSVQKSHQAGEFSDIAYNFGVCPHGSVYELRGWNRQTGANGTNEANRTLLAIVYMAGTGDPLTPKGRDSLIALYDMAFKKGVGVKAVGHGSITGSECPGAAVRNFLASGVWRPAPVAPTKIKYVLMDGEGHEMGESVAVDGSTATLRRKRLATFLDGKVEAIDNEFERDKDQQQDRDVVIRRKKA